jgi:hypothetical protein
MKTVSGVLLILIALVSATAQASDANGTVIVGVDPDKIDKAVKGYALQSHHLCGT